MRFFYKLISNIANSLMNVVVPSSLSQQMNQIDSPFLKPNDLEFEKDLEKASNEGIVLLKNKDGTLPLIKDSKIAIFGRTYIDYFYVGNGSGGNVIPPFKLSPYQVFKNQDYLKVDQNIENYYLYQTSLKKNKPIQGFWGHWNRYHEEYKIKEELIKEASLVNETSIMFISRNLGEDQDNILKEGGYYLTKEEKRLLTLLRNYFKKLIIIITSASLIDMEFINDLNPDALIYSSLNGMEGGKPIYNVLINKHNPSGRMVDTVFKIYSDNIVSSNYGKKKVIYKEDIYLGYRYGETFVEDKILYKFGYGLSYSKFKYEFFSYSSSFDKMIIKVKVKNLGPYKGKDVIELFVSKPNDIISNPKYCLTSFNKTKELDVNEEQIIELEFTKKELSSFEDRHDSKYFSSWVIYQGEYKLYLTDDGNKNESCYSLIFNHDEVIETCSLGLFPNDSFFKNRGYNNQSFSLKNTIEQDLSTLKNREFNNSDKNSDKQFTLDMVLDNKITLDQFIDSLSLEELEALTRGHGFMSSPYGIKGNAGAFGGIIDSLNEKNVPPLITCDGPSGIRCEAYTYLLPSGTALASSFNVDMVRKLYEDLGKEMNRLNVDIILGPGLNLHRSPLCGRNFEYYSEDPLLSGKMGSNAIKGIQKYGLGCSLKHFACNNQEKHRSKEDSIVSLRALRELYLRSFEIAINEASPTCIMTSYNKVNGTYAYYNYSLVNTILRKDFNFDGLVMTDWWMKSRRSKDYPKLKKNAYRVRSGIDVYMPGGSRIDKKYRSDHTLLKSLNKKDGIRLEEIKLSVKRTLLLCLKKLEKEKASSNDEA